MSNTFTVFGLQRSGTNFLEQLVTRNINHVNIVNRWKPGDGIWKHAYDVENKNPGANATGLKGSKEKAEMIGNRIHAIYVHKHPYSWIQSITNKNVDIKKTYPFVVEEGAMMLGNLNIVKLAELYRDHTKYWLNKVETSNVYHVKYEDLIQNNEKTEEIVRDIAQFFNRNLKANKINIPDKVSQSNKFTEQDREKYKKYRIQTLTYEHIQKINSILKPALLSRQGYDLIESERDYREHKV